MCLATASLTVSETGGHPSLKDCLDQWLCCKSVWISTSIYAVQPELDQRCIACIFCCETIRYMLHMPTYRQLHYQHSRQRSSQNWTEKKRGHMLTTCHMNNECHQLTIPHNHKSFKVSSIEEHCQQTTTTYQKFWLSRYFVRSTLVLGSCTRILDLSGTVMTSISLRLTSTLKRERGKTFIFWVSVHCDDIRQCTVEPLMYMYKGHPDTSTRTWATVPTT